MVITLTTRRSALAIALAAFVTSAGYASAAINGFGDGSNYTLTGYVTDSSGTIIDTAPPTISSGTLTITTASDSQARSAFYNTAQTVGPFVAQFDYRNDPSGEPGLGAADGVAFVIQNDSRGLSAIGGGGASVGYGEGSAATSIAPSASLQLLLRTDGGTSSAYETNGDIGFNLGTLTNPIDLSGGDTIRVTLAYDGVSTLTENFLDLTTLDTVTTVVTNANIASTLGVSTAFVGFTGGTGGGFSDQTISNFSFVPEPTTLALIIPAGLGLLARRRKA